MDIIQTHGKSGSDLHYDDPLLLKKIRLHKQMSHARWCSTKKSKTLISCTYPNSGVFKNTKKPLSWSFCKSSDFPRNLCAWMADHIPTYPQSKKWNSARYQKSVRNACAFRCFLGFKINIHGRYFKVFLENYLSSVSCVTGGAEPI